MASVPTFVHYDLDVLNPMFDSSLVDVVTELEHVRRLRLAGTTPAPVFFQLKRIFHMLESLGSARIEGNHTTLSEYIESKLDGEHRAPIDELRELENIEEAMAYIDRSIREGSPLTEQFIRELHVLAVRNLQREGDATPGSYRVVQVRIAKSGHLPPDPVQVSSYMQELVGFINEPHSAKYDLIKVALAHHRFSWIHPFGNGNGRVVRLLTYALLMKYGFNVSIGGRVLNPTAVFCSDRDRYYEMLGRADIGTATGLESWCEYVLRGILEELRKVDRLADYSYLCEKILEPAIAFSKQRQLVTDLEAAVLRTVARKGIAKAADLIVVMQTMKPAQRTYQIRKLVERGMLQPLSEGARQYTIGFSNNVLIRGIIDALEHEGFVPSPLHRA
jgi:Fic family protein